LSYLLPSHSQQSTH